MKKLIVFVLMGIALHILIAQTGMLNFKQDLGGTSNGGSQVPVDGGLTTMMIGSAVYIYRKITKG